MEVQVLAQQRHLWTYFRIKCGTEGNFIAFGWIHLNFRFTWLAAELETPTGRALPEWGAEWFIRTAEVPAGGRAEDFFTIEESPNRGSKGGSNPQKWLPILSSFFSSIHLIGTCADSWRADWTASATGSLISTESFPPISISTATSSSGFWEG